MFPSRFITDGSPRQARLGQFLLRGDPLADDVVRAARGEPAAVQNEWISRMLAGEVEGLPAPFRRLHDSLREVPYWVDEERATRGGAVLLKAGLLSGIVLGFKSLVLGYCSPAGNKPLAFSGRLEADTARRLAETARFVEAVSLPRGMRWGAPGFVATVKVRLIHAKVRTALEGSPRWRADEWGAPVNQYDMAGTVLLFSSVLLDGLATLGSVASAADSDATLHLWRYVARVMGVEDELVCVTKPECDALWATLEATQGAPDVDSRRLAHALILDPASQGAPPHAIDLAYALSRALIGPRYADALGYPRSRWDLAPSLLRRVVSRLDRVARKVPFAEGQALRMGTAYWRRVVALTFGTAEVPFLLPQALGRL